MARKDFHILAEWDDEAKVWFVKESDVPGLSLEASTEEELVKKLCMAIPELLDLNAHLLVGPKRKTSTSKSFPRFSLKMEREFQISC